MYVLTCRGRHCQVKEFCMSNCIQNFYLIFILSKSVMLAMNERQDCSQNIFFWKEAEATICLNQRI